MASLVVMTFPCSSAAWPAPSVVKLPVVDGAAGAPARSGRDPANDQLAVVVGVAVLDLQRLRPLEVEVQVVLPRETDAAVHLDRLAAHLARGVAHVRLRHRRGEIGI